LSPAAPFDRCLAADPYYLSVLETIVLPMRFRDRMVPAQAARYAEAFRHIRAQDYGTALALLDELAQTTGGADGGLALATAATVHWIAGSDRAATALLDRCRACAPDCAEYRHLAGVQAIRQRAPAAAAARFLEAVTLDPGFGPGWAALALLYALDDQWTAAEVPARRALAAGCELGAGLVACCLMFSTLFQGKPMAGPFLATPETVPAAAVERLLARLPAVDTSHPPPPDETGPTLFVFCDPVYLRAHALPLIRSLAAVAADCAVHLHVANPRPEDPGLIRDMAAGLSGTRIRLSHAVETADPGRFGPLGIYCACVRFCRFHQFIRDSRRPALMVDADSLFRRPPDRIPGWGRADLDLALLANPTAPPWERFLGCGIYAAPSPDGLDTLARIAAFIARNLIAGKGRWFLDQIALFLAHRTRGAGLRLLTWDAANGPFDLRHRDDSVVWTVAIRKEEEGRYKKYKQTLLNHTIPAP